ncbi:hypothetical protein Droror1_Dr00027247, partial [Drosera rotundifolia]
MRLKEFSSKEVLGTLTDIDDIKPPRRDRYNAMFYKKAWSVVWEDITKTKGSQRGSVLWVGRKVYVEGGLKGGYSDWCCSEVRWSPVFVFEWPRLCEVC